MSRRRAAVILALVMAVASVCGTTALTQETGRHYENMVMTQRMRNGQCWWLARGLIELEMAWSCDSLPFPTGHRQRYGAPTTAPNAASLGFAPTQLAGHRVRFTSSTSAATRTHAARVELLAASGQVVARSALKRINAQFDPDDSTVASSFHPPPFVWNAAPATLGRYITLGFLVEEQP